MKKKYLTLVSVLLWSLFSAQTRPINKLTLQTTYAQVQIAKPLHDYINAQKREDYFSDEFFNDFLKGVLLDKRYTPKEKVQLFYLMEKKLGYSFVGLNYLPPQQNYFMFHLGKVAVFEKTRELLSAAKLDVNPFIDLCDEKKTNDPILSSNALLLSTLINPAKTIVQLRKLSVGSTILSSKFPFITNHYVCLAASLIQDSSVARNLRTNVFSFKQEGMIEDAICALYSQPHPLAMIKDYILKETDPLNDLSIETALCVLHTKVSDNAFNQNVKSFAALTKDVWKKELLESLLTDKYPFNYSLCNDKQLAPKAWDGVQFSAYTDGTLISFGTFLEFDPY
jgi:hypothetical protein